QALDCALLEAVGQSRDATFVSECPKRDPFESACVAPLLLHPPELARHIPLFAEPLAGRAALTTEQPRVAGERARTKWSGRFSQCTEDQQMVRAKPAAPPLRNVLD